MTRYHQPAWVNHPRYPLIFDPQTGGGLLASVPADQAEVCVVALRAHRYGRACVIGQILAQGGAIKPILLVD